MQAETQTKMTILGRGSMRDKRKEEELREANEPMHTHLHDDLHILIEVQGQFSEFKLMAGVAEVRKMLIPVVRVWVCEWASVCVCVCVGVCGWVCVGGCVRVSVGG